MLSTFAYLILKKNFHFLLEYIVHNHPLTTACVKQNKIVKSDGACHNFSCFDISITHHGHPHCNHRHHHIPPHHNQLRHHWSPSHSFKNWKLLSSCLLELPAFDLAFLHCVFSNESSNRMPEQMQSHIDCTFLTFLHCEFLNASSNCLPEKMHSHIGCTC